jgi:hypothetical protein
MTGSGREQPQEETTSGPPSRGSRKGLPIPAEDSWTEWKDRCAIGLCRGPVQIELRNFAAVHFALYLRRYSYRTNVHTDQANLADGDPWHLFETYLAVRNTRQGKKYKEWLFARLHGAQQADLEALAGGAALLMRDVAREHLRREYAPSHMISLNSPVRGVDESGVTLEDLLPGSIDPVDEVAKREFEQLAASHAQEFFAAMETRERIAFLAKALGISLAHSEVEKVAGCRKSVLSEAYQAFILNAAGEMKERYSTEDSESVKVLTLMTLQEIKGCARTWARSMTHLGNLFSIAEAL